MRTDTEPTTEGRRFHLLEVVGAGAFGEVYLAEQDSGAGFRRKVAIKILNRKKIKQQGVLEKVRREIKTLRKFNHPHIIKHFEFIDTPSDIFIVLEYAANGELYDYISKQERVSPYSANPVIA